MIVGFTGSRAGMSPRQLEHFRRMIEALPMTMFLHGGCVGADTQAHDLVREATCARVHVWPGVDAQGNAPHRGREDWGGAIVHPPRPYYARNRILVSMSDLLIVAPAEAIEQPTGGTWYTYKHGRREGTPELMLWP